jgi:enoyl-CoA hydratase
MVRLERRSDGTHEIVVATLDRPERRNAVDLPTLTALLAAFDELDDALALVLTGAPPAFCAGADLTGVEEGEFVAALRAVLDAFVNSPVPTVAAVDGAALGAGTQLASVCDLRVATEGSEFGVPAARLGLVVDQPTVDRLVAEFGAPTARAMLIAAERFDARRLYQTGGVHRIGDLDAAIEWAFELASLAPLTIAAHKVALRPGDHGDEFDTARRRAWVSSDAVEGRTAFLEKRTPRFTGS